MHTMIVNLASGQPFTLAAMASLPRPGLPWPLRNDADSGTQDAFERIAMNALVEMKRDVPPPSPERMAAGKARLLALAAERRRQRLIDLAG